jgi:hypothetical protein
MGETNILPLLRVACRPTDTRLLNLNHCRVINHDNIHRFCVVWSHHYLFLDLSLLYYAILYVEWFIQCLFWRGRASFILVRWHCIYFIFQLHCTLQSFYRMARICVELRWAEFCWVSPLMSLHQLFFMCIKTRHGGNRVKDSFEGIFKRPIILECEFRWPYIVLQRSLT